MGASVCAKLKNWSLVNLILPFLIQLLLCVIIEASLPDLNLPADESEQLPQNLAQIESSKGLLAGLNLASHVDSMQYASKSSNLIQKAVLNTSKSATSYQNQPIFKEEPLETNGSPSFPKKTLPNIDFQFEFPCFSTENPWLACSRFQNEGHVTKGEAIFCGKMKESSKKPQYSAEKPVIFERTNIKRGKIHKEIQKHKKLKPNDGYRNQLSQNLSKEPKISVQENFSKTVNDYNWDFMRSEPSEQEEIPKNLTLYFEAFRKINVYDCNNCFGIIAKSKKRFYQIHRSLRSNLLSKYKSRSLNQVVMINIFLDIFDISLKNKDIKHLEEFQTRITEQTHNIFNLDTEISKEKGITSIQESLNILNESILKISKISVIMIKAMFTLVTDYQVRRKLNFELHKMLRLIGDTWKDILQGENKIIEKSDWAQRIWESIKFNRNFNDWRGMKACFFKKNSFSANGWKLATLVLLRINEELTEFLCTFKNKKGEKGKITGKLEIHPFLLESINRIVFFSNEKIFEQNGLFSIQ